MVIDPKGTPITVPNKRISSGSSGNLNFFAQGFRNAWARLESTVLGGDEREIRFDTSQLPWRMICALEILDHTDKLHHGTGWLAGPSTIVTCGHCVHNDDFGGWPKKITAAFGRSSRGDPFGKVSSNSFFATTEWIQDRDINADIGAISLSEAIGNRLGWFAFGHLHSDAKDLAVNVSGYSEFDGRYNKLLTGEGKLEALEHARLFYSVDTDHGQSGSPVWIADSRDASGYRVIGVHAYGTDKTPAHLGLEANSATRLTDDQVTLVETWKSINPQ